MSKAETAGTVVTSGRIDPNLPAHLQGLQKTVKVGNIDRSDLIIPRIKLLQAISPEITENNNAKAGQFWHNTAAMMLGESVRVIPIIMRKTFVLWSPRNDDRGILARAVDGLNWDLPGAEFTVKPKNSPKPVTYKLGKTVHEKTGDTPALSEFGSSIPDDPNSAPAAALTYEWLFLMPDFLDLGPAIVINTRSSVKPAKELINKIDIRPVDHYYGQYLMNVSTEKGDEGPYYNYKYAADGYADEALAIRAKALHDEFKDANFRADDESDEAAKDSETREPKAQGKVSSKF